MTRNCEACGQTTNRDGGDGLCRQCANEGQQPGQRVRGITLNGLLDMLTDEDDRAYARQRAPRHEVLYAVVQTQPKKQARRLVMFTHVENLARRCERNWRAYTSAYTFAIYQVAV